MHKSSLHTIVCFSLLALTTLVSHGFAEDQQEGRAAQLRRELSSSRRVGYLRQHTDDGSDRVTFVLKDAYDKTTYRIIEQPGLDLVAFVDRYVSLHGETESESRDRQPRFAAERVTALDDQEPVTARATNVRPAAFDADDARPIERPIELNDVQVATLTGGMLAPSEVIEQIQPPPSVQIETVPDSYVVEPPVTGFDWLRPLATRNNGLGGRACVPGESPRRFKVFGEYLLLRPRGFAVDYAVILENPNPDFNFPLSPVAQVDPGFNSGFRAGFGIHLDPCCRVEAAFTWFEGSDSDSIVSSPAGDATRLQALVVSQKANEDWDRGSARLQLDFQLVDLDCHCTICGLDYFAGLRYGQLTQDFHASFIQDPAGFRNGWSGIEFNGWGPRFGVGKEHRVECSNWLVYGRFISSFLAGEFNAEFRQESDDALPNDPPIEINTSNDFARIVPVLELELGVAWEDPRQRFRLSAGYLVSAWFNVVTTDNFIAAVHRQEFDDIDETITFDGLVARAEVRF